MENLSTSSSIGFYDFSIYRLPPQFPSFFLSTSITVSIPNWRFNIVINARCCNFLAKLIKPSKDLRQMLSKIVSQRACLVHSLSLVCLTAIQARGPNNSKQRADCRVLPSKKQKETIHVSTISLIRVYVSCYHTDRARLNHFRGELF